MDPELEGVPLPHGVHVLPLESLAGLGLCLYPEKEAVELEDLVDCPPRERQVELVLDPPCAPCRVFSFYGDYSALQIFGSGIPESLWGCFERVEGISSSFLVGTCPPAQGPFRDIVVLAYFLCTLDAFSVEHDRFESDFHGRFHHFPTQMGG